MRKKLKSMVSAMVIFSLCACPIVNATNENGYSVSNDGKECTTTKEFEADTDDTSTYDVAFDKKITLDHKDYELADISYEVESSYNGEYDEVEETVVITATDTDASPSDADTTITKDGFTYELSDIDSKKLKGEDIYLYQEKYYELQTNLPNYPSSVTYSYVTNNGEEIGVELPFDSINETSTGWKSGYTFEGVIEYYDADFWEVEGELIPRQDGSLNLSSNVYNNLIKNAGFDPSLYKDFSANYNGAAYIDNNGIVCRNFIANCSVFATNYVVKYAKIFDDLELEYEHSYKYSLSKASKEKIDSAKSKYKVIATAKYSIVEKEETTNNETVKKVVISAVVILMLLVFISLVVYLVKGGRKDTDYRSKRDSKDDYKNL